MNTINGKPELLAPVGDMERLQAAILYGADAVYLAGKTFGMRASPSNFDEEGLIAAVELCHRNGKRVYVTCNTLPRNDEIDKLPDFLSFCQDIDVDGLIITDLGVLMQAKKYAPKIEVHISTQAGIVNYEAARAFYELGARRVVLARELAIQEIKGISEKIPKDMVIETFVHGAMCVSFSGRCLLSNYMTGRDANRGNCAQPCRWEYSLIERKRPEEIFTVVQQEGFAKGESGTYIMNSRDLCMIQHLPVLHNAGVSSFKIEGRAKSAYYVACTTAAYRRAIDFFWENPDDNLPKEILEETEKISHREYGEGFYFGGEAGQTTKTGGYIRKYDVVAVSEGRDGDFFRLKQRGKFFVNDTLDILRPDLKTEKIKIISMLNEYMEPIKSAPHAQMTVFVKTDGDIPEGSYVRVKKDKEEI